MSVSDFHTNSRFIRKRESRNKEKKIREENRIRSSTYQGPLIAFAILFIFMGIWMMINPHKPSETEGQNPKEEKSAWEMVKIAAVENTELYKAMAPVKLKNPGPAFYVEIPKDYKGQNLITQAALVDVDSLRILWHYRGTKVGQIASMTKMMLSLVVYVYADSGFISFNDTVNVTDEAPLMGGSQAYLDRGERYHVNDLVRAVTVSSSNDASYLLAQYLGNNDVSATVGIMNHFADELKLRKTKFYNVHGLPPTKSKAVEYLGHGIAKQRYKGREMYVATKPNVSTPLEMAKLGIAITRLPQLYKWSSIRLDSLYDVDCARLHGAYCLRNHFKIIGQDSIDGIKTGFTNDAGFCVTASAKRNGRRLIAVVFGAKYQDTRDNFVRVLFDRGFAYIREKEPRPDSTTNVLITD
ncbi:MAG: D-alanyl-D-alanine carboxypeptidase family protein [Candidatus Zixiibacteriota bacterium]